WSDALARFGESKAIAVIAHATMKRCMLPLLLWITANSLGFWAYQRHDRFREAVEEGVRRAKERVESSPGSCEGSPRRNLAQPINTACLLLFGSKQFRGEAFFRFCRFWRT